MDTAMGLGREHQYIRTGQRKRNWQRRPSRSMPREKKKTAEYRVTDATGRDCFKEAVTNSVKARLSIL